MSSTTSVFHFNAPLMYKASKIFRALNHPLRWEMLKFVNQQNEVCVSDICIHFNLEHSVTSHHLAILRKVHAVIARREGKSIFYSVNEKKIIEWMKLSENLISATDRLPGSEKDYNTA